MTDCHEVDWEDVRNTFPGCGEFNDENYNRFRCKMPEVDQNLWRLVESKEWFEDNTFVQTYMWRGASDGKSDAVGTAVPCPQPSSQTFEELDTHLFEFDRAHETANEYGKFLHVIYVRRENLFPNSHLGITDCVDGYNDFEMNIGVMSMPIRNVAHFCIRNGYLYVSTKDGTIRVFKNATDIAVPNNLSHLVGKNLNIYTNTFDESHNCCVVKYGCLNHNQLVKCQFCETNVRFKERKTLVEIKCQIVRCIDAVNSVCYSDFVKPKPLSAC